MAQIVFCAQCQKPHGYQCFVKEELTVVWLCSPYCKQAYIAKWDTSSLREFMPTGGFA